MTFTPIEPVLAVRPLLPKQMPGTVTLLDELPEVALPEKMRIILAKMGFGTLPERVSFAEAWTVRQFWGVVPWHLAIFEGEGPSLHALLVAQTDPVYNQAAKKLVAGAAKAG